MSDPAVGYTSGDARKANVAGDELTGPLAWTSAADGKVVEAKVTGDTHDRFTAENDGTLEWGPGNGARDTNLYRGSAGHLKTDQVFQVGASNTIKLGAAGDTTITRSGTNEVTIANLVVTDTLTADVDIEIPADLDVDTLDATGAITAGTSVTAADLHATDDLTVGDDASITGSLTAADITATTTVTAADLVATDDLTVGDDAAITGDLTAGTVASAGGVSGTTGTFSGAITGTNVTGSGTVQGATVTSTGTVNGVAGSFSGAVSGTNITGSGTVQGATVTSTGAVNAGTNVVATGNVTGVNITGSGTVQGSDLIATDDLTVTDDATIGGDLAITGALTVGGVPITGGSSGGGTHSYLAGDATRTNSATLTTSGLAFTGLTTASTYKLEGYIVYTCDSARDLKLKFDVTNGTLTWSGLGSAESATANTNNSIQHAVYGAADTVVYGGIGAGTLSGITLSGYFITSGVGTITLTYAQNSAASSTTTVLKAGSWLTLTKVS